MLAPKVIKWNEHRKKNDVLLSKANTKTKISIKFLRKMFFLCKRWGLNLNYNQN